MIGATVSHYRIVSKLGEGGMGVVYEAEDLTLGRRVALKFCSSGRDDEKLRANLLKEARAASSLSHPNIATVYEFVENPGGDPFIAMELVSGASLRRILGERQLSIEETLKVATGVASALAEARQYPDRVHGREGAGLRHRADARLARGRRADRGCGHPNARRLLRNAALHVARTGVRRNVGCALGSVLAGRGSL